MEALENFTYIDLSPYPQYSAPLEVQKKRGYADDSQAYAQTSATHAASSPLQPRDHKVYPPLSERSTCSIDTGTGLYALPTEYNRPTSQRRPYILTTAPRSTYQYPGSSPMQTMVEGRSPSEMAMWTIHPQCDQVLVVRSRTCRRSYAATLTERRHLQTCLCFELPFSSHSPRPGFGRRDSNPTPSILPTRPNLRYKVTCSPWQQ